MLDGLRVLMVRHRIPAHIINRVSQLVVLPVRYEGVEIVEDISGGARGENGFGSSGK